MCTGGFGRRSLSRPTDLVLLSSTIVRGAPWEHGNAPLQWKVCSADGSRVDPGGSYATAATVVVWAACPRRRRGA